MAAPTEVLRTPPASPRTVSAAMRTAFAPWSSPAGLWRALCHVVLSMVAGTVSFTAVVSLASVTAGLLITLPLALPFAWLLFAVGHLLAGVERSRVASLLHVDLADPVAHPVGGSWFQRMRRRAVDGARWKELLHHVLLLPVGVIGFVAASVAWSGSLALLLLPLYVSALPGDTAKFHLVEVGPGLGAAAATVVGVVGLAVVAPWLTLGLARLQGALARVLLGPSRDRQLAEAVTRLETSRSAAVGSAEAERRRIERDLHDGAQQRLVALAAGLGAARERLERDPDGARELVADAHEEAKAALKEIRDLVRGIHPVILEDRGLDAALSAVVARSSVPVSLDVRIPERPSPVAESTAYFVVNEALTNVARHAGATRASVAVVRSGPRLVVEVRDDGVGGADATRGTGLQGLRDRVAAVGGTMHVLSPEGGPTTISVELPCGS